VDVTGMAHFPTDDWGPVAQLLLAAGAGAGELTATVRQAGLAATADVVVAELVARCDPPPIQDSVRVWLTLTSDDEQADRLLVVDREGITVLPGDAPGDDAVRIRFDVVDLLLSLFAPAGPRAHATREVVWPSLVRADHNGHANTRDFRATWQHQTMSVVHAVLAGCLASEEDVASLSVRLGTDKWGAFNWYARHYDTHLARYRGEPVRMLEIGIGGYDDPGSGGASLRMWQRYFRRGLVYGLDIADKSSVRGPRIRTIRGDQGDPAFLAELGSRLGPFDIIIDDGSHENEHVRTSFEALLPHVRDGGLYIVEDLQTAYWPGYGGENEDLTTTTTSIGMLKGLVDGLNHREITPAAAPSYSDQHVVGLHMYHNLAVIEKAINAEEGTPAIVPRDLATWKGWRKEATRGS
jgi:MycE methyltransferase N-terminal/Methyltransferase domain